MNVLPAHDLRHGWTADRRPAISRLAAGPGSVVLDEQPPPPAKPKPKPEPHRCIGCSTVIEPQWRRCLDCHRARRAKKGAAARG